MRREKLTSIPVVVTTQTGVVVSPRGMCQSAAANNYLVTLYI